MKPKPTCATCRWWEKPTSGNHGYCSSIRVAHAVGTGHIYPDPDFGCIFHEPKTKNRKGDR